MRKSIFISAAGLTIALTLLGAGCGPSSSPSESQTSAPTVSTAPTTSSISISGMSYQPQSATVAAGTNVTWTNNDSVAHTVSADDGSFDSGSIGPGATFSHTFNSAGSVNYHCTFHPNMHGSVVVQ